MSIHVQSPAHRLLTHFWEAITEDLSVELLAAAKGETHMYTCYAGVTLAYNFSIVNVLYTQCMH